jgi:uncharacterized membrane protein YcjF (UPF0283 family)
MMETVGWILVVLFVVYLLNMLVKLYRYRTDSYYRYKADQVAQDRAFDQSSKRLSDKVARTGNKALQKVSKI